MLSAREISFTSGTLNVSLTKSLLPSGEYASRSSPFSFAHYGSSPPPSVWKHSDGLQRTVGLCSISLCLHLARGLVERVVSGEISSGPGKRGAACLHTFRARSEDASGR